MTNSRFIKLFSYMNKNNERIDVNCNYGQKWSDVQTDNNTINSIFKQIDDGDGYIQPRELNLLNKIIVYIDNLKKQTANNEVLEKEELETFAKNLEKGNIKIQDILDKNTNQSEYWSENLDRNLSVLSLSKTKIDENLFIDHIKNDYFKGTVPPSYKEQFEQDVNRIKSFRLELEGIGDEQGFKVEAVESGINKWLEDVCIRRHDGKIYVPLHLMNKFLEKMKDFYYTSERGNVSSNNSGQVIANGDSFDIKIPLSDIYYGESYLEGGNVLNTINKDGKPAAIVGEDSIGKTLAILNLEQTPENVEHVKNLIAKDLGLNIKDVTFVPQYDFHIDMLYRPLHNGEIAVPDFDEAIRILEETSVPSMEKPQQISLGNINGNNVKEVVIAELKALKEKTKAIREEAEDNLSASGYKLIKIPCFTTESNAATNYMNGVGATSEKTGQTFYITNKSEYPELDKIINDYLTKVGIDKVYFVSTTSDLYNQGGIDCLTQER